MEKELNVCLINDSFPPLIDGVANTVVNYASIIQKNYGNAVVAVPEYPDVVDDYPFKVKRFPSIDTTKLVGYRAGNPLSIRFLNELNSEPIDIIHAHCPIASMYQARVLRDSIHKPLVMTYHTKFDIDIRKAIDSHMLQEASIRLLVDNVSAADEVWVVSKGAGENLKSLGYKGDYIVMPNGVDFIKGKADQKLIDEVKEKYHITDDKPTYLFVGRIMWYKGLKIIVDALKQLDERNMDFRMLFVGEGVDKAEVMALVDQYQLTDKVTFTGAIRDRDYLKAIFSACDLFLFPSTFDTNGIVVREAAASSLGSVLIQGSCAAEDVEDGENALLIEENADSMAALLSRLGNNRAFFELLGQKAMDQLYCSWDESVERATQRYREIIAHYQYQDHVHDLMDVFFDGYADLSAGVKAAHQLHLDTIRKTTEVKDVIELLQLNTQLKTQTLKLEAQDLLIEKQLEQRNKTAQKIQELKDRIDRVSKDLDDPNSYIDFNM